MTRLIGKAVARLPGKPRRIVAHVPRDLLERFDEYCEARGVTRSRALLARISRYVDEDGELIKKKYFNKVQILGDQRTSNKKNVQIIAPDEQVKGFNSFCKKHSLNKDGFFVREMLFLLDPPPKTQQAQAGSPEP